MTIDIKTQAALDKALKKDPAAVIRLIGQAAFVITLNNASPAAPSVEVCAGARLEVASYAGPRVYVTAWENSTVTARENSTVTAWENSTVTARENSTVTAWGYAFVRIFSSKKVEASENCIVALHTDGAQPGGVPGVGGGRQLVCPPPKTGAAWCDFYGVETKDGVAILYKAVNASFRSSWGGNYTPGTMPSVPVFKAEPECGEGALYFSPDPHFTHQFVANPEKYVACPVLVDDIVAHPNGSYPAKVKAKGVCAPVYEVDINGKAIAAPAEAA